MKSSGPRTDAAPGPASTPLADNKKLLTSVDNTVGQNSYNSILPHVVWQPSPNFVNNVATIRRDREKALSSFASYQTWAENFNVAILEQEIGHTAPAPRRCMSRTCRTFHSLDDMALGQQSRRRYAANGFALVPPYVLCSRTAFVGLSNQR